jgi:hypothetical protein
MKIILVTAIVLAMATSPTQHQTFDRGYRDWSKYPLELSCEGSDWPAYCETHKRDKLK